MKKLILSLAIAMSSYCSFAQWVPGTGTIYPATITDKVGIGTTSPGVTLTTRSGINALPVTSGITQPGGLCVWRVEIMLL
jgi:hypothetical protein